MRPRGIDDGFVGENRVRVEDRAQQQRRENNNRPSSPWQKSSRIGNAGETACATTANQ
ncbi:MAG TPA: hypothetical protein VNV86_14155 [Candidatus Acidoferrum sp.]|nr:hypothetical protein [Candidatus Acidoferrum sp.]